MLVQRLRQCTNTKPTFGQSKVLCWLRYERNAGLIMPYFSQRFFLIMIMHSVEVALHTPCIRAVCGHCIYADMHCLECTGYEYLESETFIVFYIKI